MNLKPIVTLIAVILLSVTVNGQTLTKQQKVEDFEYLYKILQENYPYFGVLERENGIKWLEHKDEYLKAIKKIKDDKQFIQAIGAILKKLNSGHANLSPTFSRNYYMKIYSSKSRKAWRDEISNGNDYWLELLGTDAKSTGKGDIVYDSTSLSLTILDTNNIAVLKIKTFQHFQIEKDAVRIKKYLNQVKNYKNLIIDIQDNGGGSTNYWSNHIVPLLTNKEISYKSHCAYRKGEHNERFLKNIGWKIEKFKTLKELPKLPTEVTEEDFYLVSGSNTIKPENSIGFNGEIFLLVNRGVYSSSEALAVFCKATKWATVVGEITGGDGVGVDPIIACLPNSKIIFRYPGEMGLNPDGSSNEEMNTTPDVVINGRSSEERLYNFAKTINPDLKYKYHDIPPIMNNCKTEVIIYSTNESTEQLNKKVLEHVKAYNDRLFNIPDSMIIPDTVAMSMKFVNKDIVCYGSIYGNLWIKDHLKDFPIEITPDYIKGKEVHKGKNQRLLTSWFNPDSNGNYIRLYTSQRSEEVLNINYVFHGPTNYVIADSEYNPMENGNYIYNQSTKRYEVVK